MASEIEPPSCRAAPSRPALLPQRWVRAVAKKIRGAVRSRMGWPLRIAVNTISVPLSSDMSSRR